MILEIECGSGIWGTNDLGNSSGRRLCDERFTIVLGSFLMRNRTPWSPKDRERNVDSDIPGKFLAAYTVKGSDVMDLM